MLKQKSVVRILLVALVTAPLMLIAAINTTGFNVTTTSGVEQVPLKGVWVRLAKASGGHEITHVAQSARVTATDNSGNFSFPDVAPGEYVLTFSASELKAGMTSDGNTQRGLGSLQNQIADKRSDSERKIDQVKAVLTTARISVTGGAGGPIEEDWTVKVKQPSDSSQRTSNRFDPLTLDMSTDRLAGPGKPKYKNIVLRVDGSSGNVRGQVSILK